jgi:solute carrier family 66, member 2
MTSIYSLYSVLIGYMGLSIEATLPLPQIFANAQSRSCKGFRLSVLASWLLGDAFKMFWFFTATTEIPLAFKLCGMFQAACDCFLGFQYYMYGEGDTVIKGHPLSDVPWSGPYQQGVQALSRSPTPTKRVAPFTDAEKE